MSFSRLFDGLQIGQSWHQNAAFSVCYSVYMGMCTCLCVRGAESADPLISRFCCEVWPLSARSTSLAVFPFAVIPWHMALTDPECCTGGKISLTSWTLSSLKALEKEWFSCPCLSKCLPREMAIETRGGRETFQDRHRSTAGVRYGYRAKQPKIYSMCASCIVHGLQRAQKNRQCCQQFFAWLFLWALFSVKSRTPCKAGQFFSGPLLSVFTVSRLRSQIKLMCRTPLLCVQAKSKRLS